MNNKIVIAVVAVVLIGVGIFFLTSKKSKNEMASNDTQSNTNTQGQSPTPSPSTSNKSLSELMTQGTAQKCTYEDGTNSGVSYISQGKMRGDFSSSQSGQTMKMHMLMDGKTSYTWMEGQKSGFKMTVNQSAQPDKNAPAQAVDANQKMNYSCTPWMANDSAFTPPTDVTFTDYSSMTMPQGQ